MLNNIFPLLSQITNEWQLNEFIEQREYHVNGEFRIWEGLMNEVVSPVSFNTGNIIKKILSAQRLSLQKRNR